MTKQELVIEQTCARLAAASPEYVASTRAAHAVGIALWGQNWFAAVSVESGTVEELVDRLCNLAAVDLLVRVKAELNEGNPKAPWAVSNRAPTVELHLLGTTVATNKDGHMAIAITHPITWVRQKTSTCADMVRILNTAWPSREQA